MSKLALMYACGDCFNYNSKRRDSVDLRTYTGAGTNGSGGRVQQNKENGVGKDAKAKRHQDVSVHGKDPQHAEDSDTYQPTYLAREIRVDEVGWNHFVKGHQQRPWKCRVAIVHTWRNCRRGRRWTYEQVEHELYQRDQDSEARKRDPEDSERRVCRWPTVHPMSKFALAWSLITMFVDATYTAFLVPIGIAFHFKAQYFSWYNGVDIAAGIIYWADLFMGFATGFVVIYNLRRRVIRRPVSIAEYYVRYGTFWPDFLASLPTIAEIVVLAIPDQAGGWPLHIILILRLFRMWRVVKFLERLIFISLIGRFNRTMTRYLSVGHIFTVNILYATFVFMNFLACVWYYVATIEGLERSWLTSVGGNKQDLSQADGPRQWVAAIYFITMTITTVGYGDISPTTALEQMTAVFLMLIGIIFFGFVISSSQQLIKFLSTEARRAGTLREKLEKVEVWTQQRRIPSSLTRRIRAYYAEIWLDYADANDDMFWKELPAALRTDMALELAAPLFRHSDIFKGMDPASERLVATRLTPLVVPAGHNVVQEGDEADALFLLQEGELLIMRHTHEVRLVNAPAIVGESVLLNLLPAEEHVRPITLRAIAPCVFWVLTLKDLQHIFQVIPDLKDDLLDLFRRRMEHNLKYASPEDRKHWEDMFARALLLKDRPERAGSEADFKSDVEAVSSESDGSDEHEDPNEYLEDLPAEVRAAELEGGVLPKKDDNTRSGENPSWAQEREARKGRRGKRSPKRPARASIRPEGAEQESRRERESGRAPLADVAKRSRGQAAGANDSAMRIRQESPFASFSEQAGAKGSAPPQGNRDVMKSKSQLERLRRMSSDTIDSRQPKSDLPLMRPSPDRNAGHPEEGQSPAAQESDAASIPADSAGTSDKHGIVKEYRDSLCPMGILGPGDNREVSPPPQESSKDIEQGNDLRNPKNHPSRDAATSDPEAGNPATKPGSAGDHQREGKRSGPRAQNRRLDGQRRSSTSSTVSSRDFSRRMSEFAEHQPSAEEQGLSAISEAAQQGGPAGPSSQRL